MSAINAFGYYLLKRAQLHILEGAFQGDAYRTISEVIDKYFLDGKALTSSEQQTAIAVTNYQRWEDIPDGEVIGPCIPPATLSVPVSEKEASNG